MTPADTTTTAGISALTGGHARTDHRDRIAAAVTRLQRAVDTRPGFGHHTGRATADLADGLRCVSVEGPWQIESDLVPALGGEAVAPSPGQLLRAALANCLAMGYQIRAAERGVELTSVRVTVETDDEIRGMLGSDADVPPGFTGVRVHVEIDSPADRREIEALISDADRLSPVLDTFTRPHAVEATVSITGGEG